jgi:hypothetical protein
MNQALRSQIRPLRTDAARLAHAHGVVRSVLALLALAALATLAAGCTVDDSLLRGELRFSCFSDTDCLSDYTCVGAEGGAAGRCEVAQPVDTGNCVDRDGDGFFAGDDCPTELDCVDDPAADGTIIFPGREETCNGRDDDCDEAIDEDVAARLCPIQLGVCTGATAACVDGAFQDCLADGLYGEDFTPPGTPETCDGLDNDCDGDEDEDCECIPGDVVACGSSLGICARGVQVCADDFTLSPCVLADLGATCSDDDECGAGGFCVTETISPSEDADDDCLRTRDAACTRQVCRTVDTAITCAGDGDCNADEACAGGFCVLLAPEASAETCNGRDDDCDGRIDDEDEEICDTCPAGMVFVDAVSGGLRGFCIDAYEASRPDATATDPGSEERWAFSQPGVLPWTGLTPEEADEVCEASAIRNEVPGAVPNRFLCSRADLEAACGAAYPYGETYAAGQCADGTISHDGTTGAFPACCTEDGVCDLSGNLAELFRFDFPGHLGGTSEDTDASALSCETTVLLSASSVPNELRGFRCCVAPR